MTGSLHPEMADIGRLGGGEGEPASRSEGPTELELANQRAAAAEAEARDANQALRESLGRPRTVPRAALNTAPPEPGEMPDPATDPAGFKTWVETARVHERWLGEQSARTRESNARSDRIIDDYLTDFPKLRSLRAQVFQCFRQAAIDLSLEALPEDGTGEMSQLRSLADQKVKDLLAAATAATTEPKPKKEVGEGEGEGEGEANRTDGLAGGSTSASAGGAPPKEEDGVIIKPLDQVFKDRQAGSGLF
jgi:hypothetical protein